MLEMHWLKKRLTSLTKNILLFFFPDCAGSLLLCVSGIYSLVVVCRLLIAMTSLVAEHSL